MPEVGRFISPDTIVPEPANPQSFNRYSYVRNNPVNFTDPTGHRECGALDGCADPLPPKEPQGQLEQVLATADGCEPVVSYCNVSTNVPGYWEPQNNLSESCRTDADCLNQHLWEYYNIPYTSEQYHLLVRKKAQELCFEYGNCHAKNINLLLSIISFPMGAGGAIVTGLSNLIISLDRGVNLDTGVSLIVDLSEVAEIGGTSVSAGIIVVDTFEAATAPNQWNEQARELVDAFIRKQQRWVKYYWDIFANDMGYQPNG